MPTVQTVTGPIDAEALGPTLVHEHVRFRDEAVAENWPSVYDAEAELAAALEQVRAAQAHGITTIVDPTAMFGGRDVRFMRRVAEETGMQIVACTGIYSYDHLPHYFDFRDADAIAELYVHDIEEGIQGTGVKAAFIKCAADEPGITPNVEKLHRAAARASVRTGAPIMAHSRPASGTGPQQVELFREEGVDLSRVQIAHCGDTDDLRYIEGLIESGVFVGLDRYGLAMYLPTDRRNATTAALLRGGHAGRITISQDYCGTIDWVPEELVPAMIEQGAIDDWSMTMVFERVLPWLREQGVWDDATGKQVFETNPRAWLAG
jgi:phosphotriesterase-related protein